MKKKYVKFYNNTCNNQCIFFLKVTLLTSNTKPNKDLDTPKYVCKVKINCKLPVYN